MAGALTIRPIAMPDLWAFLGRQNRTVAAPNYRAIAREVADGRVLGAFSAAGEIIGIGAISPVNPDRPPIAWLSVTDRGFGRFGLAAVRAIKSVLADSGAAIALVDDGNEQGKRLARLAGLAPTQTVTLEMRIWRLDGRTDRQNGETAGGAR